MGAENEVCIDYSGYHSVLVNADFPLLSVDLNPF